MRRIIAYVLLGIFVVAVAAASIFYAANVGERRAETANTRFERDLVERLEAAFERQNRAVDRLADAFEQVDDLKTAQELQLRQFRNAEHLAQARARGIRVATEDEAERLREQGRLVRLEDSQYYFLQDFDYSVPYVTPDAARLLDVIGAQLKKRLDDRGLPAFRFNISSVLRTEENQRTLRGVNPNATYGVSAHEYGTTLDIVTHVYDYAPHPEDAIEGLNHGPIDRQLEAMRIRQYRALGMRYWRRLRGMLGRILIDLQDEGSVMVTLEREQPVFHITVSQNLAE